RTPPTGSSTIAGSGTRASTAWRRICLSCRERRRNMAVSTSATTTSAERELILTRVFDAPRSLVFKAWTEPEYLVRWWGPQGFTTTIIRNAVRPGGAYRVHMRGPEGDDHWPQGVYREVVEPERLVMTGRWSDADGKP